MALMRGTGKGSAASDEAFMQHLNQGGELLAAGQLDQARSHLEQAYAAFPKNEKALNLLGLTYFKLGILDRAAHTYEALVRENPVDPTLRVNLGLVYLKSKTSDRAVREFETAVDLAPDHKKAHNYLGLALAQAGDFLRAREHFILASSDVMAEKMERALSEAHALAQQEQQAPVEAAQEEQEAVALEVPMRVEASSLEASLTSVSEGGLYEDASQVDYAEAPQSEEQPSVDATLTDYGGQASPDEVSYGGQPEMERYEEAEGVSAAPGMVESDWGAQFGFDASHAPAPHNPFQPPEPSPPPAAAEDDFRFAEDEGPSAPPVAEPLIHKVAPPEMDVGLEVAASPEPLAEMSDEPYVLAESMVAEDAPQDEAAAALAPPVPIAAEDDVWTSGPARSPLVPEREEPLAPTAELSAPVPFEVQQDVTVVTVRHEILVRCDALLAVRGSLNFQPETRRFRGQALDMPFGEGARQLHRVQGQGTLLLGTGTQTFIPVALGDQPAYFREEAVYGFEEALTFENGKVPSDLAAEVDLVHLSGEGHALLQLEGPLRSVEVHGSEPVTVPLRHWVGWYGNLTPRVVALPGAGGRPEPGIELTGEGFALLAARHG